MNKKNLLSVAVAVAVVGTLALPLLASAQSTTISTLQAEISSLLSQLASLRGQLGAAIASSTPPGGNASGSFGGWANASGTGAWGNGSNPGGPMIPASSTGIMCMGFPRNLSLGSVGSDVSDLQKILAQDPSVYPQGAVTGYFGPLTAAAVIKFQQVNDIASSSAGFFGPLTRDFLTKRCGGPGPVRLPPGFMPSSTMSSTPPRPPFNGSGTYPLPLPIIGWQNGSSSAPSGTPPFQPAFPPRPGYPMPAMTSTTGTAPY